MSGRSERGRPRGARAWWCAAVVFAVACASCSIMNPTPGPDGAGLTRVEPGSPVAGPGEPVERRWILGADPLAFFRFGDAPRSRRVPGFHADVEGGDVEKGDSALGPGDRPVQLGPPLEVGLDRFALAAWVKDPRGVSLRHVSARGVTVELGVDDDSTLRARAGEVSLRAAGALEPGAWQHVGLIRSADALSLVVDGRVVAQAGAGEVELAAGGRLECLVEAGAVDEVALFDHAPHHTLFMRARLARPIPHALALRPVLPMGHSKGLTSGAFGPDGRLVLTHGWDETAKLWSASGGALLHDFARVKAAAISPDGALVATATQGTQGLAHVRLVETGEVLFTLSGHANGVNDVAFDRGGDRVVTSSWDGTSKIWSTRDGALLTTLTGDAGVVYRSQFGGPNGARVLTLTGGMTARVFTARVWSADSGELAFTLESQADALHAASFDPAGERIVTAGVDGATIWSVVEVTDAGCAAPLGEMLTALGDACPGARGHLTALIDALAAIATRPALPGSPRFVATHPGDRRAGLDALTDALDGVKGALTIASPYLRPGLSTYLSAAFPGRPVLLAPAPRVGEDTVEMTAADIAALDAHALHGFVEVGGRDPGRHDHLKVYQWDGGVMLGSHNATEAALGPASPDARTGSGNWEASVILPTRTPLLSTTPAGPPVGVTDPTELGLDLEAGGMLVDAWVQVEVDWSALAYAVHVEDGLGADGAAYTIDLPGLGVLGLGALDWQPAADGAVAARVAFSWGGGDADAVERALLTRKWYELSRLEPAASRRGLVLERDWAGSRRSLRLASLKTILNAWRRDDLSDPVRAARAGTWRGEAELEGEHAASVDGASGYDEDVFHNFFDVFRARRRFVTRLERRRHDEGVESLESYARRMRSCLRGSPDSLLAMVEGMHDEYGEGTSWDALGFTLTAELRRVLEVVWPMDEGLTPDASTQNARADLEALREDTLDRLAESVRAPCDAKLSALERRWDAALQVELGRAGLDENKRKGVMMLYERITGHAPRLDTEATR